MYTYGDVADAGDTHVVPLSVEAKGAFLLYGVSRRLRVIIINLRLSSFSSDRR